MGNDVDEEYAGGGYAWVRADEWGVAIVDPFWRMQWDVRVCARWLSIRGAPCESALS